VTASELTEWCRNRYFDLIVVVTKDIFGKMSNMQKIQKDIPGSISICTQNESPLTGRDGKPVEYTQKQASYYYSNTGICFVEPVEGDTLYSRYYDRFGEGLCCIRERVSAEEMRRLDKHFEDKGFCPVQRMKSGSSQAFWLDLTEELGILYEVYSSDLQEEPAFRNDMRIAQINISTAHLQKTIGFITGLLGIGPWEVGRQCSAVAHDTAFMVERELKDQEFSFLLAILVCGNIEWEVIEPEKGTLVYSDFIGRRETGFHHILQEIPQGKWAARIDTYARDGIKLNCKGGLGPVNWCYLETEKELGFYLELRTDAVMDKLPDGYLQYYYPED